MLAYPFLRLYGPLTRYAKSRVAHAPGMPGPCITNVFATRRKNFSQWHRSFQRKLRSHWLKFLRHVAITLVIQGPGLPCTFSLPPRVSDLDMHHGTCVTHAPRFMPGLLITGFLWSRWQGKCSRRTRNPQFCISGKKPMWRSKHHWPR